MSVKLTLMTSKCTPLGVKSGVSPDRPCIATCGMLTTAWPYFRCRFSLPRRAASAFPKAIAVRDVKLSCERSSDDYADLNLKPSAPGSSRADLPAVPLSLAEAGHGCPISFIFLAFLLHLLIHEGSMSIIPNANCSSL